MLKLKLTNKFRHLNSILLFALVVCITPAQAAFVGYNFESSGNDGSTAAGFVEWDDAIAADAQTFQGLTGITQFSWVITGGVNDGLSVSLSDLTNARWDAISDALASDFNFRASLTGFLIDGTGAFETRVQDQPVTGETRYTHSNFTAATVIPIPAALFMFAPALAGLFGYKHLNRKTVTVATAA